MIKNLLRLSLMTVLICTSAYVYADEINYGNTISYDGKVNDAKEPFGKGKLTTAYYPDKSQMDRLEGKFENGRVQDAKLMLARYNGPFWFNRCVFKGTVQYEIIGTGSETAVKYTLLEGELKDAGMNAITISSDNPMVIVRKPFGGECSTTVTPTRVKQAGELTPQIAQELEDSYSPVPIRELGLRGVYNVFECTLDDKWTIQKSKTYEPIFGDDVKVSVKSVKLSSGETQEEITLTTSSGSYTYVKNCYPDMVTRPFLKAEYFGKLSGSNQQQYGVEATTAKGTYVGYALLEPSDGKSIYRKFMKSSNFEEMGFVLYEGVLTTADNKQVRYIKGRTEAEIEQERAEQQRRQEQERAELAAKIENVKKKIVPKLIGTWSYKYAAGLTILYTFKADGTLFTDYTYTHDPNDPTGLKKGTVVKFRSHGAWKIDEDGDLIVNCQDKNDFSNYNVTSTDRAYMARLNADCNRYGRDNYLTIMVYELLPNLPGGRSLVYKEKQFWDLSLSGNILKCNNNNVEFRKVR